MSVLVMSTTAPSSTTVSSALLKISAMSASTPSMQIPTRVTAAIAFPVAVPFQAARTAQIQLSVSSAVLPTRWSEAVAG